MKKHLLLAIAILCHISAFAANKVILNPETETNSTDMMLVISKIELTDTETILFFDAYQRPGNWIRIDPASVLIGSNQKTYKITGSEGIVPGEKVFAPKSGHIPFSLRFQPVDKNEKSIDFKEGNTPDDWAITGIKLYEVKHSAKAIQCVLRGEIINRPQSSRLLLIEKHEDWRVSGTYFPIRNGKFEYTLTSDCTKEYELIFFDEIVDGSWRPIPFICETGTVDFTLYSRSDNRKNSVTGGPLTAKYYQFRENESKLFEPLSAKRDSLESKGQYYSLEYEALRKQMDEAFDAKDKARSDSLGKKMNYLFSSGEMFSQAGKAVQEEAELKSQEAEQMKLQFVKDNPDIVGYSFLVDKVWWAVNQESGDATPYIDLFNTIYAEKYPDHPYTQEMAIMIKSLTNIKVGGNYIDFTAPDAAGNQVTISDVIKNKVALIHLWASWCGPCRRNGKAMIPVYEAYKDKGFTVVGVARESTLKAMQDAIQKDKYPWLNLIELKGEGKIWSKYGVGNAGGGEFLVDENGVILAIKPTAEEVKAILEEKFK